jgi:hypothetical protein
MEEEEDRPTEVVIKTAASALAVKRTRRRIGDDASTIKEERHGRDRRRSGRRKQTKTITRRPTEHRG